MATQSLRFPMWWRKWARREFSLAAGFAVLLCLTLSLIASSRSRKTSIPNQSSALSALDLVPFTALRNAEAKGALCLDGSLPGFHFQKGFESGANSWVLHIEGGGWCHSIASCSYRKNTALGSSKFMDNHVPFSGILSSDPLQNPDFFNWNKVKIRYCDGASFAGRSQIDVQNGTTLFFRGQLIWETLMDELLSAGLSNAREALLSGCSAGGLATLIHCDSFAELLPKGANVKCLVDAGFFLNEKDIAGKLTMDSFYRSVVNLQGIKKSLNGDCVTKLEPYKCFFPQAFINNIKTPIFLVNPSYDFWQIRNILVPDALNNDGSWLECKMNINKCDPSQTEMLQGFRNSLLDKLRDFQQNEKNGVFINSCYIHCQTWMAVTWHSQRSPRINNRTIAESVGDWYFNRRDVKLIDCPYPCNPTCYHMVFT